MALTPIRTVTALQGPARLYLRDDELVAGIAALFEAAAMLKTVGEQARAEHDLTWAELRVLLALAQEADTVMGLASRLSVTKQALTRNLDGLERDQLIERVPDPRDRRRRITRLTAQGQDVLMASTGAMRQRLASAYRAAGGESVAGCDKVLATLIGGEVGQGRS